MKQGKHPRWIAAVAVLILLAAALLFLLPRSRSVDPRLAEALSIGGREKSLARRALQNLDDSAEADGVRFLARQALTYDRALCVLVEAAAPEGTHPDLYPALVPGRCALLAGRRDAPEDAADGAVLGRSGLTEIVFADQESGTVLFLIRFAFDESVLEKDVPLTLTLGEPGEAPCLSWTVQTVEPAVILTLEGEGLSGTAALTPLTLRLDLSASPYPSAAALTRDLSLVNEEGEAVDLPGSGSSFSFDGAAVRGTVWFRAFLDTREYRCLKLGPDLFAP
jgi:hypothetical protein